MEQEFFIHLPTEIITDILSRLPVRSIVSSKCVCKSWLHLLKTDEFVNSHLAKSIPMLAALMPKRDSSLCTVIEFEDELDLEGHDLHYNPLSIVDFPHGATIQGSANGLLLLIKLPAGTPINIRETILHGYVCNPITRDYTELHHLQGLKYLYPQVTTFGFGASKVTGQHKVVQITTDSMNALYECHVHTLGTESWRSIEPVAPFKYGLFIFGVFLNGSLHWKVSDSNGTTWISCFDLETELFSTFSTPSLGSSECLGGLSALEDHLCLCDYTQGNEFVIWLMKEYGADESWTMQYVIRKDPNFFACAYGDNIYPIKVFKDGDILMKWENCSLFYYSSKTKTIQDLTIFSLRHTNTILLTPSLRNTQKFRNGECYLILIMCGFQILLLAIFFVIDVTYVSTNYLLC